MLKGAKLADSLQKGLWAECTNCATVNENLSVSPTHETLSYIRFVGEPSKLIWNLRTFGEMVVAATRIKIQGKILNKGKYGRFVGYAPNHALDVYRILKMANRRIVMSRDICWLKKHYYQWSQGQDDIDDEEMATIEQIEMETEGDEKTQETIVYLRRGN
jgi:hypothetical protein